MRPFYQDQGNGQGSPLFQNTQRQAAGVQTGGFNMQGPQNGGINPGGMYTGGKDGGFQNAGNKGWIPNYGQPGGPGYNGGGINPGGMYTPRPEGGPPPMQDPNGGFFPHRGAGWEGGPPPMHDPDGNLPGMGGLPPWQGQNRGPIPPNRGPWGNGGFDEGGPPPIHDPDGMPNGMPLPPKFDMSGFMSHANLGQNPAGWNANARNMKPGMPQVPTESPIFPSGNNGDYTGMQQNQQAPQGGWNGPMMSYLRSF